MRSSQGFRKKTRNKLSVGARDKFTMNRYLQELEPGQRVALRPYGASQKGMPFPKFTGLTGTVTGKRGRAYVVRVMDGGKEKTIISLPEHLKIVHSAFKLTL